MLSGASVDRRSSASGYSQHSASNVLSMMPEISSYASHPRYEHAYSHGTHPTTIPRHAIVTATPPATAPRHAIATGVRPMGHQSVSQWNPPAIMTPVDQIGPYVCSTFVKSACTNTCEIVQQRTRENYDGRTFFSQ
jgi:hypothetical protein